MALTLNGFDEFLKKLSKLDNDEIPKKCLSESVSIVETKLSNEVPVETGDLQKSIKATKVLHRNDGYMVSVRPTGTSKKKKNADKLAYIEFGTSRQIKRPVVPKVIQSTENQVLSKMQEVFDREIGGN